MSKDAYKEHHEQIDSKSYRKNKYIRFFMGNPLTISLVLIVVGASLLVVAHATSSLISVRFSLSGSASDSGVTFEAPMTTNMGGHLLPNTKLESWANARATVKDPVPTPCVNLECTDTGDNGAHTQGQFRLRCWYSHFNYDDPIVKPGAPGTSHLHMYWGNTHADANTHYDLNDTSQNSLTKYGGGTCQGAELNRTAYWQPALMDGTGNVVLPYSIVVYYKANENKGVNANQGQTTVRMPEGLKMIGGNSQGNTTPTGYHNVTEWDCYDGATSWVYPPDVEGKTSGTTMPATCPDNHYLHSVVVFPQCYRGSGLATTDVVLQDEQQQCPAGWVHMPQVSYVIQWPKSPTGSYKDWYLASDRMAGQPVHKNGSTLHGDWFGGWQPTIMNTWTKDCIQALRNCGPGQMGQTYKHLLGLPRSPAPIYDDFAGPYFVKAPM